MTNILFQTHSISSLGFVWLPTYDFLALIFTLACLLIWFYCDRWSPEARCQRKGHDWRFHHRVGYVYADKRTAVVDEVDQKRIECFRCGCLPVEASPSPVLIDPHEWEEHEWLGSVQSFSCPSSTWRMIQRGGMDVESEYWSRLPLLQEIAGPEWDEIRQKTLGGE